MGMVLFQREGPFQLILNTPSTVGSKWNLVKITPAVSGEVILQDHLFRHVYSPGVGNINLCPAE